MTHASVTQASVDPPAGKPSRRISPARRSRIEALDQAGAKHWKGIAAAVLVLGAGRWRPTSPSAATRSRSSKRAPKWCSRISSTQPATRSSTARYVRPLAVKIAESPYLDVYPKDKMIETLELMERSPEDRSQVPTWRGRSASAGVSRRC